MIDFQLSSLKVLTKNADIVCSVFAFSVKMPKFMKLKSLTMSLVLGC